MKEKLKKFFNKDRIFVFICLLCIIAFCVLYAILYYNDKKQVSDNSTIILYEDENNLNKSWSINNDGNLVGTNLININNYILQRNTASINVSNNRLNVSLNLGYSDAIYFPCSILANNQYTLSLNINNLLISDIYLSTSTSDSESGLFQLITYSPSSGSYTFVASANASYIRLWLNANDSSTLNGYIDNLMLNEGSTPLPWEPYGVWYSETNYGNLEKQFDIISGNINPLSVNNISSNTLILNSIDVTSQLQGAIFLSDLSGGLGFYNTDFDGFSSFSEQGVNEFNLVSIFNNIYTIYGCTAFVSLSHSAEDYLNISLYRDNQLILTMSDLDSETTQEYMQTYSNQEIQFNKIIMSGKYTDGLSNRQGTNYIIDNNNYAFGYQQGYKDSSMYYDAENTRLVGENAQLNNDLTNLDAQYTILINNYSSLLEQYNLLNNDKYTFTELFWSISAVPFGVLTSAFNVNVLGFNLAAIITGLFTSLLLIWLIKKFFK